ncbi:hypothetical protein ACFO6R_15905 [Eubacterium multiforme]|uniref:Uncharacterized protein n=1 Tax=Eubacterium multiforme TaxID=83339 RepID=A0ABT9UTN5_9FIRM|nr:hypothetical protein [Eubacterium multiforme]MDQ0149656.1 hypothetical protein [Eubacterium multiforme]
MKKKLISLTLLFTLGLSSLGFTPVYASELNKNTSKTLTNEILSKKTEQLSQDTISKANPYVKLKNNQFYLSNEAKLNLTENEYNTVKQYINNTNNELKNINKIKNNPNILVYNSKNSIKVSVYENINKNPNNKFMMLISTSKYIDIEYTWWGAKVFFSHKAVGDLNDAFTIGGLTAGTAGKSIGKFLAKHGVSLSTKFLGPISLYGTAIFWAMSKVDKGRGVFLNCVLYIPATITPA